MTSNLHRPLARHQRRRAIGPIGEEFVGGKARQAIGNGRRRQRDMVGLLALAAIAASGCPIEKSQYVLRGMPEVTAYYRAVDSGKNWPSQLAMAIHSSKTGETSWWVPWNGGTDGRTNIASTTDATRPDWRPPNPDNGPRPHGNRLFLTTDASYNIMHSAPKRGKAAPAHLLAPEAGGSQDKIFFERQFFDLVSCSASDG